MCMCMWQCVAPPRCIVCSCSHIPRSHDLQASRGNGNAQVDARQVTAVVNLVQTALNTAAQSAVNASQAANADAKASQPSFSPVYAKLPRTRLNLTKNWEHSLDFHDDLDLADYRKRTFMCLLCKLGPPACTRTQPCLGPQPALTCPCFSPTANTPYKEEYVTEKCVAFFEVCAWRRLETGCRCSVVEERVCGHLQMGWPAFYYYWYSPTDAASHIRHLMATESIGDSGMRARPSLSCVAVLTLVLGQRWPGTRWLWT